MRITNTLGLPAPLVRAIENDPYNRGDSDISVTQLIQPARKVELERLHEHEIVEDASERLWALDGQVAHSILERAAIKEIVHHRLFIKHKGWTISGELDLLDNHIITDWKRTSVWSVIHGPKLEWEQQTNLYAFMCIQQGFKVDAIQIVALLRDWSKPEAWRNRDYPQVGCVTFQIPVWSQLDAERFLNERVKAHQAARTGDLPECTEEERWAKPTRYAVRKRSNKRATAVFDTLEEAEARRGDNINMVIDERPAEWTRCLHYCAAAPFCQQFQAYKQTQQEPEPAIAE